MPYVAVSRSPIHVRHTGEGPVDPDYGIEEGGGNHPDNSLPRPPGPVDPGYGIPLPPVTIWPTPPRPPHAGHPLPPTYPVRPDNSLPRPPHVWPMPPRPVHPDNSLPPQPVHPSLPIYHPVGPDNSLPMPPASVYPPLPPELGDGEIMIFVWIPGVGYRWIVVDTSLRPEHPIAPPPAYPDNALPGEQPGIDNTLPGDQPGVDNSLPRPPGRPPRPDNTLPGQGGRPDNTLPPTPQPKT